MAKSLSDSLLGYNVSKKKSPFPFFQFQQTQNFLLPPIFTSYKFSNCRTEIPINGKTLKVYLPKADQILTDYASEVLSVYSTIVFIKLVDKLFISSPGAISFANVKLEYAITLYSNLYQVSTVTPEIRTVLSAYFSNSVNDLFLPGGSFFTRLTQTNQLKQSLPNIEKKYLERLKNEVNLEGVRHYEPSPYQTNILLAPRKVEFPDQPTKQWIQTHQSDKVFNDASAQSFINIANAEISTDINVEFETNRAKALGLAANVISDPRFRMSLEDPRWNEYDETIKKEVAFYNQKFNGVAGFVPLDWRYIKAMVWTEVMAGPAGNSEQWIKFPMQIGRFVDDLGYVVVRDAKPDEGADLVVPKELSDAIQDKSKTVGHLNVRAGIAYLYIRYIAGIVSEDEIIDSTINTYTIKPGDTVANLISKGILKTTQNNIVQNTAGLTKDNIGRLTPGQTIKFQTAKSVRKVSKWKDPMEAIKIYNIGDPNYMQKFQRAYEIIKSRTN